MKKLLLILCLFVVTASYAQIPKQHIFYDTIKTVKERVDFSPDTIPVYFRELGIMSLEKYRGIDGLNVKEGTLFGDSVLYEKWQKGYVVWQTYHKSNSRAVWGIVSTGSIGISSNYYKEDYEPSKLANGIFLYSDRKTKVTNKVIFSIKR